MERVFINGYRVMSMKATSEMGKWTVRGSSDTTMALFLRAISRETISKW
jgi:hypothetical protein